MALWGTWMEGRSGIWALISQLAPLPPAPHDPRLVTSHLPMEDRVFPGWGEVEGTCCVWGGEFPCRAGNPRSPSSPQLCFPPKQGQPIVGIPNLGGMWNACPSPQARTQNTACGLSISEGKQLIQEKIRASPPTPPLIPTSPPTARGWGPISGSHPSQGGVGWGGKGAGCFCSPQREGRLLPPGVGDADLSPTSPVALPGPHGGLGPSPCGRGRGGLLPAPGSEAAGAGRAEAAGVCAARRSQELTLLAGGSCAPCTSGGGLRPRPRPPPGLALPSRNAGSAARASGARFWGQPASPPAPGPGLGVGAAPPGFPGSSLLLPLSVRGRPAAQPQPERVARLGLLPWCPVVPSGPGDLGGHLPDFPAVERREPAWSAQAPCPGSCGCPLWCGQCRGRC